jgi:hypothetical protein
MRHVTVWLLDELANALARRLHPVSHRAHEIPFAALGRSGCRMTARDMEKLLACEWNHGRDR